MKFKTIIVRNTNDIRRGRGGSLSSLFRDSFNYTKESVSGKNVIYGGRKAKEVFSRY